MKVLEYVAVLAVVVACFVVVVEFVFSQGC